MNKKNNVLFTKRFFVGDVVYLSKAAVDMDWKMRQYLNIPLIVTEEPKRISSTFPMYKLALNRGEVEPILDIYIDHIQSKPSDEDNLMP